MSFLSNPALNTPHQYRRCPNRASQDALFQIMISGPKFTFSYYFILIAEDFFHYKSCKLQDILAFVNMVIATLVAITALRFERRA